MSFFNIFLVICLLLTSSLYSLAQTDDQPEGDKKFKIALEGMFGVAVNSNTIALNVGGPNIRLKLKNEFSIGLGAFPSLYISDVRTEPKLGLSPRVDFKKLVLITPVFHFNNPERWLWTFGVGYKFH